MDYQALLKNEIIRRFGKQITSTQDSKDLAEDIFLKTRQRVNYNTIRRLFEVVRSQNSKQQPNTLTVLSQYCGYKDYVTFCNRKERIDVYELDDYMLEILSTGTEINYSYVSQLCKTYYNCIELYNFLEKLLLIARNTNQTEVFKWFYSLPEVFDDGFNKKATFQLGNVFGICLQSFSYQTLDPILKYLAGNTNAREFFIEKHVDIDNLNGYYGHLIDYYLEQSSNIYEQIFVLNLRILHAFLNNNRLELNTHYKALKKIHYKKEDINHILFSRCHASDVFFKAINQQSFEPQFIANIASDLNRYYGKKNKTLEGLLFANFIFQAFHLTRNYHLLNEWFSVCTSLVNMKSDYWTENLVHSFMVTKATCLLQQGKTNEAAVLIEQINPVKFVRFEKNLQDYIYYSMLFDFYKAIDDPQNQFIVKQKMMLIAEKGKYAF